MKRGTVMFKASRPLQPVRLLTRKCIMAGIKASQAALSRTSVIELAYISSAKLVAVQTVADVRGPLSQVIRDMNKLSIIV
jgi:hypothetical protein